MVSGLAWLQMQMSKIYDEHEYLNVDSKHNIKMSSENNEWSGHGLDMDLLAKANSYWLSSMFHIIVEVGLIAKDNHLLNPITYATIIWPSTIYSDPIWH